MSGLCKDCLNGRKTFKENGVTVEFHGCKRHNEVILIQDKTHYSITNCHWNRVTYPTPITKEHYERSAKDYFDSWKVEGFRKIKK